MWGRTSQPCEQAILETDPAPHKPLYVSMDSTDSTQSCKLLKDLQPQAAHEFWTHTNCVKINISSSTKFDIIWGNLLHINRKPCIYLAGNHYNLGTKDYLLHQVQKFLTNCHFNFTSPEFFLTFPFITHNK